MKSGAEKPTWAIALLVFVNLAAAIYASSCNFATRREMLQIPAGLSHWRTGTFDLAPDSPPLARMIAALPVMAAGGSEWFLDYLEKPIHLGSEAGDRISMFFAHENGDGYFGLVRMARIGSLAWWLLGAWIVHRWASELGGGRAGRLALLVWCFEPTVAAYEQSATPDLAGATAGFVATYVFRRCLLGPTWPGAAAAGALLGVALLVDVTPLYLIVAWAALGVARPVEGRRPLEVAEGALRRLGRAAIVVAACLWVVNVGYGRSDVGPRLGGMKFVSRALGGGDRKEDPFHGNAPVGNRFAGSRVGDLPLLVPDAYLRVLDQNMSDAESVPGDEADGRDSAGRVGFSWRAIAFRTPPSLTLMIAAVAALAAAGRLRMSATEATFLLAPAAVAVGAASCQVGLRWPAASLSLVVAPFAAVAAGQLAGAARPDRPCGRIAGVAVASLACWLVWSGMSAFPDPAAYLNELGGGPGDVAAQVAYGDADSCRDLLRLDSWIRRLPGARTPAILLSGLDEHDVAELLHMPPRTPSYYPPDSIDEALGRLETGDRVVVDDIAWGRLRGRAGSVGLERPERVGRTITAFQVSRAVGARETTPDDRAGFRDRVYTSPEGESTRYSVFLPKEYRPGRPHPLILFLHGVGDAGTEGTQYLKVGLPRVIERRGDSFGFLVVCPQGREGLWAPGSADAACAMGVLDAACREFDVDPDRIYLTGLSSGGSGVFSMASSHPYLWAAVVPVSSNGGDPSIAPSISRIPCWCFQTCTDYGRYYRACDDSGSPPAGPRRMIEALLKAGGRPRYTEYLVVGDTHDAWDRAYTNPGTYEWLLSHVKQ